jgi:Na+-transporting NADH:ubiquinone oxidoreductase subunit B
LKQLFLGLHPGSIGETSALLCFLGAALLIAIGVASYRIILGGVLGLILTSLVFNLMPGPPGTWFSASPLYHLCSGGFALGISFMATDPVSAPGTDTGRWIYGFLIGFFVVLLRAVNPAYVEGVMLAILFMNIFSPLIDVVTVKLATRKRIPNV